MTTLHMTYCRETLAAPSCVDLVLTELSAGDTDAPSPATLECTPRPATLLTGLTLTCKLPPSLNKYTLITLQNQTYLIFGDTSSEQFCSLICRTMCFSKTFEVKKASWDPKISSHSDFTEPSLRYFSQSID